MYSKFNVRQDEGTKSKKILKYDDIVEILMKNQKVINQLYKTQLNNTLDKVDYDYEEKILITQGKSNALTKDEIKKVKSGVFDFDVYGRIHETYQINIDGKSTISNLANFKKLMEKRFKDYNNMQMW